MEILIPIAIILLCFIVAYCLGWRDGREKMAMELLERLDKKDGEKVEE